MEVSKKIFTIISERSSDVAALAELKHDMVALPKPNGCRISILWGKRYWPFTEKWGEFSPDADIFQEQIQKIEELDKYFKSKQNEYEQLKKETFQ